MSIIKILEENVENFELLKHEVFDIIKSKLTEMNQICLQSPVEGEEDWYSGIGVVANLKHDETAYKFIQPSLKGSVIESLINKYSAYRSRIMHMPPRWCYSVHPDPSCRLHIPITTNKQTWMVWPFDNFCYRFENGKVYWVDTRIPHTCFNGALENRVHLVLCVE